MNRDAHARSVLVEQHAAPAGFSLPTFRRSSRPNANPRCRSGDRSTVVGLLLIAATVATALRSVATLNAAEKAADAMGPDQLLLRDYRPRSIFNLPATRVEKARYPVIDVHSHAYAKTEAEVDRWVATMDAVDERIVNLVAEGLSDKQIGTALGLSPQTIRNRVSRMLNESGLRNRTELAVQFVRNHPDVMGKVAI